MKKIKVVFFGTHDFAVSILNGLVCSPDFSVELAVTQPDKPVGRKKELETTPVKTLAQKLEIPVIQPDHLKNFIFEDTFDVGVVAQYGLLIPAHLLNAPTHGMVNVHTSLLPKYRGASPIQTSIMNGETETGITIMKMDSGMDTGDILEQSPMAIGPNDTYKTVEKNLANIGAQILPETLEKYINGHIIPHKQNDKAATICKQLSREDGKIDWNKKTEQIYNLWRGLTPWPGIWTLCNNKRLKLLDVRLSEKKINPGKMVFENGTIYIGTKNNSLCATRIQLEGKKEMDAETFVRGFAHLNGTSLS